MNHWWLDYEHENETKVNPKDRMALEGLTGKMPILLHERGSQPQLSSKTGVGTARSVVGVKAVQSAFTQNLAAQVMPLPE